MDYRQEARRFGKKRFGVKESDEQEDGEDVSDSGSESDEFSEATNECLSEKSDWRRVFSSSNPSSLGLKSGRQEEGKREERQVISFHATLTSVEITHKVSSTLFLLFLFFHFFLQS